MQVLRLLLNKLEVADYFNRDWEKEFKKEFAPGSAITIKFPWRPSVTDGMGYTPQAISRLSTTINLDQWLQIGFEWDDYEAAVKLERSQEELQANYWEPCAAAMSQEFDSRAALWAYQNSNNIIGVLGTDPTTVQPYYQARQRLKEKACPPGPRGFLISSSMMQTLGVGISTLFAPPDQLTAAFKEGAIGKIAGATVFESNSIYSHTAGTWASTVSVTGAGQNGGTLSITGTAGDTIKAGDKFSIANVNAINPMTKRVAGKATAQQFTCPQAFTLTAGPDTITNHTFTANKQIADSLAAAQIAAGLDPIGLDPAFPGLLSRYAFALTGAKLFVPKSTEDAGMAQDPQTGIAIRKVKAWDPVRSMQVNRMDSLGGFGNLYQDNGSCCILGA